MSFAKQILIEFFNILVGIPSNGDALLLERTFIGLGMSSFENSVNENEYS